MTITEENEALVEAGRLNEQMNAITNKVDKDKRAYTVEENAEYERLEGEFDAVKARIARAKAADERTKAMSQLSTARGVRVPLDVAAVMANRANASAEYRAAFDSLLREGEGRVHTTVKATLVKQTGSQGGYLAPIEYETRIIEKAYPLTLMRKSGFATQQTSTSDSVIPMEGNLPTFGWIDELGTYPETDVTFGQGAFSAYKIGGVIRASEEIIQDAFVDLPNYIADRSKVALAQAEDAAFFQGDGVKKPRGITLDALLGVTAAAAATFTSDEVLDFVDSLDDAYAPNAKIVATKAWRSKVRKMKDTTGQYLWQPGLQAGVPDLVSGKEIYLTPYLGAVAATNTVALVGDFSYYQILDRLGFYLQQLNETYALNGQVGFKIHKRLDGKLLVAAAVRKMVMAAA